MRFLECRIDRLIVRIIFGIMVLRSMMGVWDMGVWMSKQETASRKRKRGDEVVRSSYQPTEA